MTTRIITVERDVLADAAASAEEFARAQAAREAALAAQKKAAPRAQAVVPPVKTKTPDPAVEAKRLAKLQAEADAKAARDAQLAREKRVVADERRFRVDELPLGHAEEVLTSMLWGDHAWGWPVLGWPGTNGGVPGGVAPGLRSGMSATLRIQFIMSSSGNIIPAVVMAVTNCANCVRSTFSTGSCMICGARDTSYPLMCRSLMTALLLNSAAMMSSSIATLIVNRPRLSDDSANDPTL